MDRHMALTINPAPGNLLPQSEIDIWRDIPTAVISDDLNRTQTMHAAIKPLGAGMDFAGQALTIQTMVGDNATLHYALAQAWPGCVLTVDARGHTETAIWGGILTAAAIARGVRAVIIDGAVRDVTELRESGLAVYARAAVPNGPHKGFGGTINGEIQCAGALVRPGDLIVGDADGVVVIPADKRGDLLPQCQARIAKEEDFMARIANGESTLTLMNFPPPDEIG